MSSASGRARRGRGASSKLGSTHQGRAARANGTGPNNGGAKTENQLSGISPELQSEARSKSDQINTLNELFPDWAGDDLVMALSEAQGDLDLTIARITEGHVSQWGQVKRKPKSRSAEGKPDTPQGATESSRGRGRSGERGRGRGDVRGRVRGRGASKLGRTTKEDRNEEGDLAGASEKKVSPSAVDAPSAPVVQWGDDPNSVSVTEGWAAENAIDPTEAASSSASKILDSNSVDGNTVATSLSNNADVRSVSGWSDAATKASSVTGWTEPASSAIGSSSTPHEPRTNTTKTIPPGTKSSWANIVKPAVPSTIRVPGGTKSSENTKRKPKPQDAGSGKQPKPRADFVEAPSSRAPAKKAREPSVALPSGPSAAPSRNDQAPLTENNLDAMNQVANDYNRGNYSVMESQAPPGFGVHAGHIQPQQAYLGQNEPVANTAGTAPTKSAMDHTGLQFGSLSLGENSLSEYKGTGRSPLAVSHQAPVRAQQSSATMDSAKRISSPATNTQHGTPSAYGRAYEAPIGAHKANGIFDTFSGAQQDYMPTHLNQSGGAQQPPTAQQAQPQAQQPSQHQQQSTPQHQAQQTQQHSQVQQFSGQQQQGPQYGGYYDQQRNALQQHGMYDASGYGQQFMGHHHGAHNVPQRQQGYGADPSTARISAGSGNPPDAPGSMGTSQPLHTPSPVHYMSSQQHHGQQTGQNQYAMNPYFNMYQPGYYMPQMGYSGYPGYMQKSPYQNQQSSSYTPQQYEQPIQSQGFGQRGGDSSQSRAQNPAGYGQYSEYMNPKSHSQQSTPGHQMPQVPHEQAQRSNASMFPSDDYSQYSSDKTPQGQTGQHQQQQDTTSFGTNMLAGSSEYLGYPPMPNISGQHYANQSPYYAQHRGQGPTSWGSYSH